LSIRPYMIRSLTITIRSRGYSSVVERALCMREARGSNPRTSNFFSRLVFMLSTTSLSCRSFTLMLKLLPSNDGWQGMERRLCTEKNICTEKTKCKYAHRILCLSTNITITKKIAFLVFFISFGLHHNMAVYAAHPIRIRLRTTSSNNKCLCLNANVLWPTLVGSLLVRPQNHSMD
jgi:hypothetical protein